VYLIQDGFTGELLAACDQIREVALLPSGKGETAAYEAEFMPGHRVPFTVLPTIDARPVAPVPRQFAQLPRHRLLMSSPPSQLELRVFDESKREGFLPTRIRHLTAELSEPPVADCLLEHKAREIRAHEQLAMRRQEALELIPATPLTGAGTPFLADWTLSSELQDRLFAYKVERGQSEGKNNPSAHVEVMQSLRRLGLAVVDWLITTKVGAADQHSVESLCRSFQRGDGIERLRMEYPEFWSLGRPLNYEIIAAAIGGEADQVLPWLAGNAFIGRIPRPVVFELINGEVLKNAAKVDAALPGELRAAEATWTQLLEELKQNIDQFEAVPNEGERSGEEEVQSQYEARRGGVQTEPEAPPASATESLTQPG
jgi:hypothetical protein